MDILRNADINTFPLFSLKGLCTYAKLLSNYDGDTGDILLMFGDIPMHLKARFMGYDTCEMKPSLNDPNRDEKKRRAKLAKQRLWCLCTGLENDEECKKHHKTLIKIKCDEYDKYGRLLILAFPEDYVIDGKDNNSLFKDSINNKMILEGHGYAYEGGTKKDF